MYEHWRMGENQHDELVVINLLVGIIIENTSEPNMVKLICSSFYPHWNFFKTENTNMWQSKNMYTSFIIIIIIGSCRQQNIPWLSIFLFISLSLSLSRWQVPYMVFRFRTELMNVSLCRSFKSGRCMRWNSQGNVTYELVLTFSALPRVYYSSY